MLIEIIGDLPVDSDITSFLQNFILVHKWYQYYKTNVAFFNYCSNI